MRTFCARIRTNQSLLGTSSKLIRSMEMELQLQWHAQYDGIMPNLHTCIGGVAVSARESVLDALYQASSLENSVVFVNRIVQGMHPASRILDPGSSIQ